MIFDMTANANGRKLPTLDQNYPLDQALTFIQGNENSVSFECRIAKDGRPTQYSYQWYLDGSPVNGATGLSCTLTGFTASGNHTVFCSVKNAAGTVQTRTATLTVNMYTLPVLNGSYPKDVSKTFIKGNTVTATFEATISTAGNPESYTYQWYVDNAAVSGATGSSYSWTGSAAGTHTVYCKVTNAAGTVQTRVATLSVVMYYTPVLNSSYPANATVTIGNSVTCKVSISTDGNPESYTYQWYVDNAAVSGATSSSYTFTPTEVGTTTVYCNVKNAAGTVKSRTATITANNPYLINGADYCTSFTGGWNRVGKPSNSNCNSTTPSTSLGTDCVIFKAKGGDSSSSVYGFMVYTANKIDLTKYNTLIFNGTTGGVKLAVWSSIGTYTGSNAVAAAKDVKSLDVSSLSGSYYIGFYGEVGGGKTKTTTINSMYLE